MAAPPFFRFWRHLTPKTIRRTVARAARQRLPGLAAEMAFNSMLALFPAVLAVLTAIGIFSPLRDSFQTLTDQLIQIAPDDVVNLIQEFATELSTGRERGLFSLSFAIALWASSGALSAAMVALDQIHRIPHSEVRPFWKAKIVSLGLTLGSLSLLIIAITAIFIGDMAVHTLAHQSEVLRPGLLTLWSHLSFPLALMIISINFAFIYRFGPSRWRPGKPLYPGALLAAIAWALISNLFRLYVTHFGNYRVSYGAIGTVIVLLLWLYLSSLVMLIGDQLNVVVGEAMQQQNHPRKPRRRRRQIRVKRGKPSVQKNGRR